MIGIFILTFVILFLIFIIQNPIIKFILFTIFSILFGLMLSRTLMVSSPEVIKTALIGTLSIFVTMFLFTIFLLMIGVNLDDRFGLILLFALIIMIITMVVLHFMGKYSAYYKIISGILLFLFSLFIVYDTSNILTREEYIYNGDFITASMDYYLDIINIFVNMLSINQ
jgi:modulator of FtsH protease